MRDILIWDPETGILDEEDDLRDARDDQRTQIQEAWKQLIDRHPAQGDKSGFLQRLKRSWAIETGIIEGLYDLDESTTKTLISQGIHANLVGHGSSDQDPEKLVTVLKDHEEVIEGIFMAVEGNREISIGYIRELHHSICKHQETFVAYSPNGERMDVPLSKGKYKINENYVQVDESKINYCPPAHVADQMEKLLAYDSEHQEKGCSPEFRAAFLHHRFTQIHPFEDGNGRVARALATLVLVKANMFPFEVPRAENRVYRKVLSEADNGRLVPFITFIMRLQAKLLSKAQVAALRIAPPDTLEEALDLLERTLVSDTKIESEKYSRFCARVCAPAKDSMIKVLRRIIAKLKSHESLRLEEVKYSKANKEDIEAMISRHDTNLIGAIWDGFEYSIKTSWPNIGFVCSHSILDPNHTAICVYVREGRNVESIMANHSKSSTSSLDHFTPIVRDLDAAMILYLENIRGYISSEH